jgi:LCP family protein required for cell wall assembly
VGSDSREGLSDEQVQDLSTGRAEGRRTDSIMVLYIPDDGEPTIVSVPRDSYVPMAIPGYADNKINTAFADAVCGTSEEGEEICGGPAPLVETFERASGVRIDHYAEIGMGGFVDLVDAVGGVELCPEEAMQDPKAGLDIEAGCQEMDGGTALGYVRTRATASSDFGRVERQRAFISALLDKATSPSTMFNPFRIIPLATGLSNSVAVDRTTHVWHLAQLGLAMRGLKDGISTTVPVRDGVVNWDKTRSKALFDALAADERPPENALGP